MDPFALQHAARRRLPALVALAVLAVAATVAATGMVLWAGAWAACAWESPLGLTAFAARYPQAVVACFAVSAAVVLGGLVYKVFDLSSGDELMRQLGAKQVVRARLSSGDDDLARLRLYNVCEEMAIAAGLDMPSVWVMEDVSGINALAAGSDPSAAAVCVTAGALRNLTRDELQGVVAHEFSHILNGDMRLNFRLTALVAGISLVSRTGKGMLSLLARRKDESSLPLSFGKSRGGLPLPLPLLVVYVLVGVALALVGGLGAFFARLVQGAISQEREYLADAAAAQFTRNPEALADVLRLTSLADAGKAAAHYGAWRADVAHLMFTATGVELLTTHPPVAERIRRLSPRGVGADASLKARVREIWAERRQKVRELDEKIRANRTRRQAQEAAKGAFVATDLPPHLLAGARDVRTAGSLLGELLGEPGTFGVMRQTLPVRRALAFRCVNTLRDALPPAECRHWAQRVWDTVVRDGQVDSFEVVVCAAVRRQLLGASVGRTVPARQLRSVAASVIATVATFGAHPEAGYLAAWKRLSLFGAEIVPMPEPIADAESFLGALDELVSLAPLAKKELLFGLRDAAAEDGVVQDEETDYIAAVAEAIGAYGWLQAMAAR